MIHRCLLNGLFIFLAVSSSSSLCAANAAMLMRLGDSAYVRRQYDSAAYYFEQASHADKKNALVQYKLGNANYRLQRIGLAVLAYERALKQNPAFGAASENLLQIQQQINQQPQKNEVFLFRWWDGLTRPSLSNTWAVLGIACFCISIGLFSWKKFSGKKKPWINVQLIAVGVLLGISFTALSYACINDGVGKRKAVVMQTSVVLQSGAATSSTSRAINVPEGLVVEVLRNREGQWLVALPDGRKGLIQPSDIALVE